tara:strand:+ start:58 stop:507 length:450 start_codon:yes stop_codon:yes gene_type:complete
MYSYITAFLSISFICYTLSQIGNFYDHYRHRARAYERAHTYLQTETCTNPRVKASLGEYNLCDQSEKVMDKTPLMAAIFDTAEDIHICGNGYCSLLGHNITNSLPQIIITTGIFALLLLWASGVQLRKNHDRHSKEYWSLPFKQNKKSK